MECTHRSAADIIHFNGQWNRLEREAIAEAASHFESNREVPTYGEARCRPWICCRYEEHDGPLYLASRVNYQQTYQAPSVEQLSERIREAGHAET